MTTSRLSLVIIAVCAAPVAADTHRAGDASEFNKAVNAAKPGDTILVAPGEYASNFSFRGIRGEAGRPIVIAAANPEKPPRFAGPAAALHFSGPSHIELRDLHISGSRGNGLNIDDGGDAKNAAHHITLRNLRVSDIGPRGNSDGIKLSGLDDFRVEDCVVEKWGSNGSGIDMVGCRRGEIVNCVFRKGGDNGVQAKGGSSEITIRRCRFEDAGSRAVNLGGSTGESSFRKRLLPADPDAKYEAKDLRVEGCTFIGGGAGVAFVGVDGATVRFNTFYHPSRYVVRILQENTGPGFVPSRGGIFEHNIVVFRASDWAAGGVNIGPKTAPDSFRFAGNLWYCEDRPDRSRPQLPTAERDGIVGRDPKFKDVAKGDFGVAADSPARDIGAHALPDAKRTKDGPRK